MFAHFHGKASRKYRVWYSGDNHRKTFQTIKFKYSEAQQTCFKKYGMIESSHLLEQPLPGHNNVYLCPLAVVILRPGSVARPSPLHQGAGGGGTDWTRFIPNIVEWLEWGAWVIGGS